MTRPFNYSSPIAFRGSSNGVRFSQKTIQRRVSRFLVPLHRFDRSYIYNLFAVQWTYTIKLAMENSLNCQGRTSGAQTLKIRTNFPCRFQRTEEWERGKQLGRREAGNEKVRIMSTVMDDVQHHYVYEGVCRVCETGTLKLVWSSAVT